MPTPRFMKQRLIKALLISALSIGVLVFYLLVSYILAGDYLEGIKGSDTIVFLARLKLIAQSFPDYAFWNYKEGAGIVLTNNYPVLLSTLIIFLSKISAWNVIEWTKILGFLSIPLFSFGIYLFGWRLRAGLAGFLAGLFYILSPIAYIWLFAWGFYAEAVVGVLFPLLAIAFDLYLETVFKKDFSFKRRLYFALTAILLSLSLLSHPLVFLAEVFWITAYGLLLALKKGEWRKRLARLIKAGLGLGLVVIILTSFWLLPFIANNQLAELNRSVAGSRTDFSAEYFYYNDISLKEVLSFWLPEKPETARFYLLSFPLALSVLLPLGLLMALIWKRKKLLACFLIGLAALLVSVSPQALMIVAHLPLLKSLSKNAWLWRVFIFADRLMIPLLAAWGLFGLVNLIIYPFKFIQRRWVFRGLRSLLVAGMVLVLTGGWLWYWRNKPGQIKDKIMYGRGVSQCNIWELYESHFCTQEVKSLQTMLTAKQAWLESWSRLSQANLAGLGGDRFLEEIPGGDFWRMDFTSDGGAVVGAASALVKNSLINSYDWTSILFNTLLGVQYNNFWGVGDDLVYVEPRATPEICQWYGVRYTAVNLRTDLFKRFQQAGFKSLNLESNFGQNSDLGLMELPQAEPIVAVNNKPRILVFGRQDYRMYDLVFRKALFNVVPYQEAMFIKGGDSVTDYSPEELKQFEMIWLYGYQYKNQKQQQQTWQLLDEYLKAGGRLFMDTGWQYTSDDWQLKTTPEFYPTAKLVWQDLGTSNDYYLKSGLVDVSGIDLSRFRPLVWEGQPWGLSTDTTLKSWVRPILTVQGVPLIAGGNYGAGRVIWSGMNILNHIDGYDWDNEENKLLKNIVTWLLEDYQADNYVWASDYTGKRISPDRVEFTLNKAVPKSYGLYFKEAYHPYWQAAVNFKDGREERLKIYRAGPEFKYVFLPELQPGDKLVFWVTKPWWYGGLKVLAGSSFLGLLLYVLKPSWLKLRLKSEWLNRIKARRFFSLGDTEEDNY
jgi:hypothetical protein